MPACVPATQPASDVPREPAVPREAAPSLPAEPVAPAQDETKAPLAGVFHRVKPGQTVWRIARAYGVSIDVIVAANGLADPTAIEEGSRLFIPGAVAEIDVPVFPARPPDEARAAPQTEPPTVAAASGDFAWPVAGGEILSLYGVHRRRHTHAGLDIRGGRGQEIVAAADGVVMFSGDSHSGYGRMVVVDHGGGLTTLYAHGLKLLVKKGDAVTRGRPIALVGRSGNATTEHCHFEVRKDDGPVDPLPYFGGSMEARR